MEYIPGGELYNLIERYGRIDENKSRKYFQQIVSAIEYSHMNAVSHRDIKLENILLDSRDNIKITDFGLSSYMKDGEFLETACGSPNYAAPELLLKKKYCGTEADVWSLGVLLYTLLAAALPFDEPTLPCLYDKIKKGECKFPLHFSPLAEDLIRKCLTVDPMKRIRIPDIKIHPWCQKLNFFLKINSKAFNKPVAIDQVIFQSLFTHPVFSNAKLSEILLKSNILKRNSFDLFITCYEMLADSKSKNNNAIELKKPIFSATEFCFKPITTPNNWLYCIRIKDSLQFIMTNLFTILIENDLEWKIIEKFKIRVKTVNARIVNASMNENNREPGCRYIKFQVILYSILNEYALDFRLITGETMYFMDLFLKIYMKLSL